MLGGYFAQQSAAPAEHCKKFNPASGWDLAEIHLELSVCEHEDAISTSTMVTFC